MFSLESAESVSRALGARLRAMRLARNLSQQELARMAGASLSSLRRLEADGRGTIQLMVALAQAMQATQALDELFAAPAQTIAQIEAAQRIMARKRARKPALAMDRAGG